MKKTLKPFLLLALFAILALSSCFGHSHDYVLVEETKASCLQDGVIAHYECECGKYFDLDHNEITDIVIPKLGHNLTQHAASDATCTESGNVLYWHCERCGKNYIDQTGTTEINNIITPAIGHDYELIATWNDSGECTYYLQCKNNNAHKIDNLDGVINHTDDNATCTEKGNVIYTLTVTYEGNTYASNHSVETAKKEHNWHWVIDTDATENTDGVKHEVCSVCGEIRNEGTIIPHNHTHELTKVDGKVATETEAGFKSYYVCDCGKYFEDAEGSTEIADLVSWKAEGGRGYLAPLPKPHNHEYTLVPEKNATCTEAGNIEYYICNVTNCSKLFVKNGDEYEEVTETDVIIPLIDHSYGEWSVSITPSVDEVGLATRECALCHHIDELTLPVVNNDNYASVIKTPATCGSKGVHTYTLKSNDDISFDLEDIETSGEHGELQVADISTTYTFTKGDWYDSTESWKSGSAGNTNAQGVQVTTKNTGANAITKDSFNKITRVVVVYSTNASKGAGNISIKVGSGKEATEDVTETGGTTDRELEFVFNELNGNVKITVTCTTNSIYIRSVEIYYSAEIRTLTKHEGFNPTCEDEGLKTYYECPICHKLFEYEKGTKEITDINTWKTIPANGHKYGTPTYEWNDGYCTAKKICLNDESHVKTETVLGAYAKDTDATCEDNEKGHLVATFETDGFEAQSTSTNSYVVEDSALGHNYNNEPSRYSYSNDKWYKEFDCTRCDHVKKEETDEVVVAINNVGFDKLQTAIDSDEVGDIRLIKNSTNTEDLKLSRDVTFVTMNYNGNFDFNGHKLTVIGEFDKLILNVSKEMSDEDINSSISIIGKNVVIDRSGEKAVVSFVLAGIATIAHKNGNHTNYQTFDEALAAFSLENDDYISLNDSFTIDSEITISKSVVLDFATHTVTATGLLINDNVVFTVYNGIFKGQLDIDLILNGKLVIKEGYHAHVIDGGFDIHQLSVIHHDEVAPTCVNDGSIEYWECDRCHDKFLDEACNNQINNITVSALEHNYGAPTYEWSNDNKTCTAKATCTVCDENTLGYVISETVDTTSVVTITDYVKDSNWYQEVTKTYTASYKYEGFESVTKNETLALVKANTINDKTNSVIYVIGKVTKKEANNAFLNTTFELYYFKNCDGFTDIEVGDIVVASGTVILYNNVYELSATQKNDGKLVSVLKYNAKVDQTCTKAGVKAYYVSNDLYFEIDDELNVTLIGDIDAFNAWKSENGAGYIAPDGHLFAQSKASEDVIWDVNDINKPILQVRFKCGVCGEKTDFITVYIENDSNYDFEKGIIVVNGQTYNATVHFEGSLYNYELTRLKTKEEVIAEVNEDIDVINKSLYSDYTLPTSISVEDVDILKQTTELTYIWTFENNPATVITYTSPEDSTELTYHLCVMNDEEVLIEDKEVIFTLVSYSLLNSFNLEFNNAISDEDKNDFEIKLLQGNELISLPDNFKLIPNHEYTMKAVSTKKVIKDASLYYVENEERKAFEVIFADQEDEYLGLFTFVANGHDFILVIDELTSSIKMKINVNNATIYDDASNEFSDDTLAIGTELDLTAVASEGYRLDNITILGCEAETDLDSGIILISVTTSNIIITVTTVKIYKVTFNKNFNTDPISIEIVVDNGEKVNAQEVLRTGYTLISWQTVDGEEFDFENTEITEDITLNAVWEANKYTVTFNTNGGNELAEEDASKEVAYDAKYGILPASARAYYEFSGWFTEQNNGIKINAESDVNITEDQVLYAHWTKIEYALDKEDINLSPANNQKMGDVEVTEGELKIGEAIKLTFKPASVAPGNFIKVKSLTIGTDEIDVSKIAYNNSFEGILDIEELKAKHIDNENEKVVMHVVFAEYEYVEKITNALYTFTNSTWADSTKSWISGSDGYNNAQCVQVTTAKDGANAITKNSFNKITRVVVVYSTNKSSGEGKIGIKVGSGDEVTKDVTKEGGTTDRALEFVFNELNGNVKITVTCTTNSIYIKSVEIIYSANVEAEVSYYNVSFTKSGKGSINGVSFAENENSVTSIISTKKLTFNPDNGYKVESVLFGETPVVLVDGKYTFDFSSNLNDINVINVVFSRIDYSITYEGVDGATFSTDNPVSYNVETETFALINPTKAGYIFRGWTFDNQTEPIDNVSVSLGSAGNKTFTANWQIINYNLVYNGVDGATNNNPIEYTIESEDITLIDPTKAGYSFVGWTFENQNEPIKDVTINQGSIGDREFTAHFTVNTNTAYTVEHYQQNVDDDEFTLVEAATENKEGTTDTTANAVAKSFTGFTVDNENVNAIASGNIAGDGSLVLKLYYNRNTYTISLHLVENDANLESSGWATVNGISTQTFRYGAELTLPTPTSSKSFVNWADAETEGNIITGTVTVEGTLDAWARWSTARIVRFDPNTEDAVLYLPENAEIENDSYSIQEETPTRVGYTFVGWNTNKDATEFEYKYGEAGKNSISNINSNIVLYAIWAAKEYTVATNATNGTLIVAENGEFGAALSIVSAPGSDEGYSYTDKLIKIYHTSAETEDNLLATLTNETSWTMTETYYKAVVIVLSYNKTAMVYTITYKDQGGTDFSGTHGSNYPTTHTYGEITTLVAAEDKEDATFGGWFKDSDCSGDALTTIGATEIITNITLYAKWTNNSKWVETELTSLTESDIFVIVGNNGSDYALTNNNGTSSPSVLAVTISNGKITSTVSDNIKWKLGKKDNGYIFYDNGSNETWLYCTNTNNGVRVGTNTNNVFSINDSYLYNIATSRYVGIYNSQDWRCYTSTTTNIQGQTFKFYKLVA